MENPCMPARVVTQRAIRAACHVALEHGLRFDEEPRVIHAGSNLLLHLHPAPVVARVATTTAMVREGDAWLTREVAVADHVARQGAPTVAPSDELPPGPHHFSGLTMTFWRHVTELPEPADAAHVGEALRRCHEALASYDGRLPELALIRETEEIIERFAADGTLSNLDAGLLREAAAANRKAVAELNAPLQPVHGDAHLGNVINTPDGPLWTDWEDTCLAPRAWDLACLVASGRYFGSDPAPGERAAAAYGESPDEALVQARRLQGTVWAFVFARDHPDRRPYAERLLAQYR
jgi:streptomycin 6-kinase